MELAAPTEGDIVRLFNATPRDLGMTIKMTVTNEKGKALVVYPMRLEDFPVETLGSTRRLRFSYKTSVLHGEEFLNGTLQLAPEQGATWMDYLGKQQVGKWEKDIKMTAQRSLPDFVSINSKAEDLQSERQHVAGVYERSDEGDADGSEAEAAGSEAGASPTVAGAGGKLCCTFFPFSFHIPTWLLLLDTSCYLELRVTSHYFSHYTVTSLVVIDR